MYSINRISKVYLTKVKRNNYFVMESLCNEKIILNLSKGKDVSNYAPIFNKKLNTIYDNGVEYQENIELNGIDKIYLKSNVELINNSNNKVVSSPYLFEVIDKDNKKIYIDAALNQVYSRNNHYRLKEYDNTVIDEIYVENKKVGIFFPKIMLKMCKMLSPFMAIDEEDLI